MQSVCLVLNRTTDGQGYIAFVEGDVRNVSAIAETADAAIIGLIRTGQTPVRIKVLPPREAEKGQEQ